MLKPIKEYFGLRDLYPIAVDGFQGEVPFVVAAWEEQDLTDPGWQRSTDLVLPQQSLAGDTVPRRYRCLVKPHQFHSNATDLAGRTLPCPDREDSACDWIELLELHYQSHGMRPATVAELYAFSQLPQHATSAPVTSLVHESLRLTLVEQGVIKESEPALIQIVKPQGSAEHQLRLITFRDLLTPYRRPLSKSGINFWHQTQFVAVAHGPAL